MTKEKILIEALEEAEFDKCIILNVQLDIERLGEDYFRAKEHWKILFDNKFCKNLFGENDEIIFPDNFFGTRLKAWKHHQNKMLEYIQEEKEILIYIEKYLKGEIR